MMPEDINEFYKIHNNSLPLIMAHRGDSSKYPENTILSFRDAYNMGVDVIETDVRMTRDGVLVFNHDSKVDRTTNGKGKISSFTFNELQKLDAGYRFRDNKGKLSFRNKGLKILSVREVLDEFKDIRFNMDIKDKVPKAAEELAKLLKELDAEQRVQVGSFHQKQINYFRTLSNAPTSAGPIESWRFFRAFKYWHKLSKKVQNNSEAFDLHEILKRSVEKYFDLENLKRDDKYNFPFISLTIPEGLYFFKIISKEFIRFAHNLNIAVFVWTINDKNDMERLLTWGVDGIFTDKPLLLKMVRDLLFKL
ncbi:MAG: glycerophosphodiester phosphodiesterase [Promethearchaeota archaeon]